MIPYLTTAEAKANWRSGTTVRINRFDAEPVADPKPFQCPTCREKLTVKPTKGKTCPECMEVWE